MKKEDLLRLVNGIEDGANIEFTVSDINDNYTIDDIGLNDFYPDEVELVLQLDENFIIMIEKSEDEKHMETMEYVYESISNGQRAQAIRLFIKGGFTFEEFIPGAAEYGIEASTISSIVDGIYDENRCKNK